MATEWTTFWYTSRMKSFLFLERHVEKILKHVFVRSSNRQWRLPWTSHKEMSNKIAAPPPLPATNPVTRGTLLLHGVKQVGMLPVGTHKDSQAGFFLCILWTTSALTGWCCCQTSCFTVLMSLRKWGLIKAQRSQAGDLAQNGEWQTGKS